MQTFEINIVGETSLNDEEVGKQLDAIHDYVERVLKGECGMTYTPNNLFEGGMITFIERGRRK